MSSNWFPRMINLIILLLILAAGLFLSPTRESWLSFSEEANYPVLVRVLENFTAASSDREPARLPEAPIVSEINLLFFGDLMLDRNVAARLENKHLDLLLKDLAASVDFLKFDLVGANLEGAVTLGGEHYAPHNLYDFAFLPERVAELKDYNFSYFSLANNHFSDQGVAGVKATRDNLQAAGFYFSGDTDAQVSEHSWQLVTIKDQKFALVSLSMVYNNFDEVAVKELLAKIKPQVDYLIVNIHWGVEYEHNYRASQERLGKMLIDEGTDIVIGHHPHVVQGMEVYRGRPIFYSLGNFIFDQYFSSDTQEGLALSIKIKDAEIEIELLPLESVRSAARLMTEDKKRVFLENFASWSKVDPSLEEQIKGQKILIAK